MAKDIRVRLYSNSRQFNSEMASVAQQMRLVRSEFNANRSSMENWGNNLNQAQVRLDYLNQMLTLQGRRVNALRKAYEDAVRVKGRFSKEAQNLATRLNNAQAAFNKTETQIQQTTQKLIKLRQEASRGGQALRDLGARAKAMGDSLRNAGMGVGVAGATGFYAMQRAVMAAFDATSNFEYSMSGVEAVTQATGQQMQEMDYIARELGRTTIFTASQAAEGMQRLALAGWDAQEVMAGISGMLNLAAAGGLELANAADITSNTMEAFSISADEATRAADVFAYAQANANTTVEQMGEAMKYAAPVSAVLGWTLEETAAAQMEFANNGIRGTMAGQAFATSLSRLARPTGQMEKLMKDLGLSFFDSEGQMRSMPEVLAEIEKATEGMTQEQQSAVITTLFGAQAYKHWAVLLGEGSESLAKTTEALENSDGAAKRMAETMVDNVRGGVIQLKSAFEGLQINLVRQLEPAIRSTLGWLTDMTRSFSLLSSDSLKTIASVTAIGTAMLGVTAVVGGVTAAFGALFAMTGPLGLAIVGVAAGLTGLTGLIVKNTIEANEAKQVNLDLAKSFSEQANGLQEAVDRFDELSDKAEISNEELFKLYEINEQIKRSKSSDEIEKLQKQYEKLAKESGLSKEEIQELFEANDFIINQSPDVEKSISNQGDEFVKSTEKVEKYIETLREQSRIEVEAERAKLLAQEEETLEKILDLNEQLEINEKRMTDILDNQNMTREEIEDRIKEINERIAEGVEDEREAYELDAERYDLIDLKNGKMADILQQLQDERKTLQESLTVEEERLEELRATEQVIADIYLANAGINKQGEEGLTILEETLAKNKTKIRELDKELETNGKLTVEQQQQYDTLVEQNRELSYAQDYILNELEMYGSINSLVESQLDKLSETTQEKINALEKTHEIEVAEGNILEQIREKNDKLAEEREQLKLNREEQGANKKEIDKQIEAINEKINIGDEVILQMLTELDVLELVRDGIQLNGDQLQEHLEQLGYTAEEAFIIAQQLSGETVTALEEGTAEARQAGKDKIDAYIKGMEEEEGTVNDTGFRITGNLIKELEKLEKEAETAGKTKGEKFDEGLESTHNTIKGTGSSITDDLQKELDKGKSEAEKSGKDKGSALNTGLGNMQRTVGGTAFILSSTVSSRLGKTTDGGGGRKAGRTFNTSLSNQRGGARAAGTRVATSGRSGLASVKTGSVGRDFVSGFRIAIANNSGIGSSLWNTAKNMGSRALSALRSAIRSSSPSKETMSIGKDFIDGFVLSIDGGVKETMRSVSKLGKDATDTLKREVDKNNNDLALMIKAGANQISSNKNIFTVEHKINSEDLETKFELKSIELQERLDKIMVLFERMLQIQNNHLLVAEQGKTIVMDEQEVGRIVEPKVTEIQDRNKNILKDFRG